MDVLGIQGGAARGQFLVEKSANRPFYCTGPQTLLGDARIF